MESFGERVVRLIESLGLDGRVHFIPESRPELGRASFGPPIVDAGAPTRPLPAGRFGGPDLPAITSELLTAAPMLPGQVLARNLEGGPIYRVCLGTSPTEHILDLSSWPDGFQTAEHTREALARVEAAIQPLTAIPDLDAIVRFVPGSLANGYVVRMDPLNAVLTINPNQSPSRPAFRSRGPSVQTKRTAQGGHSIQLADPDGQPARFATAEWVRVPLHEAVEATLRAHGQQLDHDTRLRIEGAGFGLAFVHDILRVTAEGHPEPVLLVPSPRNLGSTPRLVSVCSEVTLLDFDAPPGRVYALRKPVVYFWPRTPLDLRIEIHPQGDFIAQYPRANAGPGCWELHATPDGMLRETSSGRIFAYLFWEAEGFDLAIDPDQAHCVPGAEAAEFLEHVAAAYQLDARERTDFVSYWLPALEANPYSLVQLLDPAVYDTHARMRVTPEPDTLIRLFMIFEAVEGPRAVGAPKLPEHRREGFCVVEWGGVNLDE